MVESTGKR